MAKTSLDVTETELLVLQRLWNQPRSTIRELAAVLYPDDGTAGYATVQKLLDRLEQKNFVVRERGEGPAHRFLALVRREDLIGRRLQAVAESLCGGSLVPLLSHLVSQSQPLSAADRLALENLITRLEPKEGP